MNGFEQIKLFYSWVFNNQDKDIKPQHISLYNFLINQNNRNNWVEWFKCPFDLAMAGSGIGNKKTYYSCLADLCEWKLIEYRKGINDFKAPLIKVVVLNRTTGDTATVPQSEPLPTPLPTPLPIPQGTPLPTHIYKLITLNLKHITDNYEAFEKFIESLSGNDVPIYGNLLHKNFIKCYSDWYLKKVGVKYKFQGGVDGKSVKGLIDYIKSASKEKTGMEPNDEDVINAWSFILNNHSKWESFNQKQLKLSQISSNLPNIMANIKGINGISQRKTGQPATTNQDLTDIITAFYPSGDIALQRSETSE